MKQAGRAFTPAGLALALAVFIFLGASLFAFLSSAWQSARDQKQTESEALGLPHDSR